VLEDENYDFLLPRMGADGNLYCIRRPYVAPGSGYGGLRGLLDLVLLPFRILFTIFQFLNFFTMRYAGKTLVTSGNMRQKQPDMGEAAIMMNLQQVHNQADMLFLKGKPVPKSWVLMKRRQGAQAETLHSTVLSYDLSEDGTLIVTDGKRITLHHPNGRKEELVRDEFISQVVAL